MPVEKQNHFSKMCRSKRNNSVPPAPQGIINFTETELQDQDSSSSEEYVYVITDQVNAVTSNWPEVQLKVHSVLIPFLIDSGASVNVLARQHYEKLALQDIPTLQNTNIHIYPYCSKHPFPILEKLDTFVAFEGKSANVPFYVVNGNHQSLLSYARAGTHKNC